MSENKNLPRSERLTQLIKNHPQREEALACHSSATNEKIKKGSHDRFFYFKTANFNGKDTILNPLL